MAADEIDLPIEGWPDGTPMPVIRGPRELIGQIRFVDLPTPSGPAQATDEDTLDWVVLILQGRLDAVGHLHHPQIAELLSMDCATDNCDHEDECPLLPTAVCAECNRIADEVDGGSGEAYPAIKWPCPTALALGVKPTQGARP